MRLRSLLFVPGDRPDRFAKAAASGADGVILDLEDSVSAAAKAAARQAVATFCSSPISGLVRLVRLNAIDTDDFARDVEAARHADGVVLPKAEGATSVARLVSMMGSGTLPILPIACETPVAVFTLGEYRAVADRLLGLTWGAEDLPAAIGAGTAREADGSYTDPYRIVRSLTLFAAHAARVPAIETVFPAFADQAGLERYAERGARDGFAGMMAIHPSQVAAINRAFTPSAGAVAEAQEIAAAFASAAGASVLSLDGRMIDAPHLKRAQSLLARAGLPLDGSDGT